MKRSKGFTLAELLIALAILGVIATFTIPKVLQASSSGQNTAVAKEAAGMISGAFQAYALNNTVAAGDKATAITPFMNYVKEDTGTTFAAGFTGDTALQACSATLKCLVLHNGGVLQYDTAQTFGTGTTPAIYFNLDPDGSGNRGRISFMLGSNGRLTTGGNTVASTSAAAGSLNFQGTDPTYLQNWN